MKSQTLAEVTGKVYFFIRKKIFRKQFHERDDRRGESIVCCEFGPRAVEASFLHGFFRPFSGSPIDVLSLIGDQHHLTVIHERASKCLPPVGVKILAFIDQDRVVLGNSACCCIEVLYELRHLFQRWCHIEILIC